MLINLLLPDYTCVSCRNNDWMCVFCLGSRCTRGKDTREPFCGDGSKLARIAIKKYNTVLLDLTSNFFLKQKGLPCIFTGIIRREEHTYCNPWATPKVVSRKVLFQLFTLQESGCSLSCIIRVGHGVTEIRVYSLSKLS